MNVFEWLEEHQKTMCALKPLLPLIEKAAQHIIHSVQEKGKILWMGNGGSAADAQHLAAELIGKYKLERPAISSIALTVDTSILTSLSNDYDYSILFSRQLEALCQPNDVVIGLSTSGNSKNVLKGIETAQQRGAFTIGLTGCSGGALAQIADLSIIVPSDVTPRIQEAHIFIGHSLCEYVEQAIYSQKNSCQSDERPVHDFAKIGIS